MHRRIVARVDAEPRDVAQQELSPAANDQVRGFQAAELDRHGLARGADQGGEFVMGQRERELPTVGRVAAMLGEFDELAGEARAHAGAQGRAQAADRRVAADEGLLEEALLDVPVIIERKTEQGARDPREQARPKGPVEGN